MTRGKGKRIKRCRSSSSSIAVLPIDIIEKEILCRLPVKTLLRCKSVCKLWCSIIKNPNFINNHYHHNHNRTHPIALESFLVIGKQMPIVFNPADKPSYAVWPMINGGRGGGNFLFSYYLGLPFESRFVRPVNGFLLLLLPNRPAEHFRMAIFNPATRQFRKLGDFKFNALSEPTQYTPSLDYGIFGFGICKDSSSSSSSTIPIPHVYKVVWLNVQPNLHVAVAKVYTIGSGSRCGWRMINAALPGHFVRGYSNYPDKNISMNGKCYWLSRDFTRILVFDMDEEVFQEMNSPVPSVYHSSDPSYNRNKWDAVFSEVRCCGDEGNSLALFVFGSGFVDMLVMDKEELHWVRRKLTCTDRPICDLFNPLLQFEFPITDSTILLKSGRRSLALYDPKTNGCMRFCQKSATPDLCTFVTVFNFKESLFSVDGGIQVSDCVFKKFCTF